MLNRIISVSQCAETELLKSDVWNHLTLCKWNYLLDSNIWNQLSEYKQMISTK